MTNEEVHEALMRANNYWQLMKTYVEDYDDGAKGEITVKNVPRELHSRIWQRISGIIVGEQDKAYDLFVDAMEQARTEAEK